MNIYVTEEIKKRWPSHEFRDKPRKSIAHGFTYIEGHHKVLNQTFYYVFGADSFVDQIGIKCGAPELIFASEATVVRATGS